MTNPPTPQSDGNPITEKITIPVGFEEWRKTYLSGILRTAALLGAFPTAYYLIFINFNITILAAYGAIVLLTVFPIPQSIRSGILVLLVYTMGVALLLENGVQGDASLFLLASTTLTLMLFDWKAGLVKTALDLVTILVAGYLITTRALALTNPAASPGTLEAWIVYSLNLVFISAIINAGLTIMFRQLNLSTQQYGKTFEQLDETTRNLSAEKQHLALLTEQYQQKSLQLQTTATITRQVAEIRDVTELMSLFATLTAERFGYYHVGIFLLGNDKKTAFLQAASSFAGRELIGQGFKVEIGEHTPMAGVIEQNSPHIISDLERDAVSNDINLPLTRSRMLLPMKVRGEILGILDIHSDQDQAFKYEDADALQSMADLVAVSIDNVRLINETRALLGQLETLTSYQTQEDWRKFSRKGTTAYQYTPTGIRPAGMTDDRPGDLDVPLLLRGVKIGKIRLQRKDSPSVWSERERILVQKIAEQVALALDNSRLVEEAQENARRDQLISRVSNRVRETLDVDSMLHTAADELQRIFDLKEAEVSLGTAESRSGPATSAPPRKSPGAARTRSNS